MCLLARRRSEYCHLSIGAEEQPLNKTSLALKEQLRKADFLRKSITFKIYLQICVMCFLTSKLVHESGFENSGILIHPYSEGEI